MADIQQNTLYLTTAGTYVARDHLTLQVEVPVYPDDMPEAERKCDKDTPRRKVAIPIHHLESICVFGASTISAPALDLCWEHGVAVNYLSAYGHLQARMTGIADTSVTLRRTHFRVADDPAKCAGIARQMVAGKIQNSRNSLLRAARESEISNVQSQIGEATDALARLIRRLAEFEISNLKSQIDEGPKDVSEISHQKSQIDQIRGLEGMASNLYFAAFSLMLKQQREAFAFKGRSRRPPGDRINCLLSFLYALVRHDCIAGLTAAGLDPFVGFLHVDRANRPSLALDLMEEFGSPLFSVE